MELSDWVKDPPTKEDIVSNSATDTLYASNFTSGKGKYFNFFIDEAGDFEVSPQIKLKVTVGHIKEKNDINRVVIEKYKLVKHEWQKSEEELVLSSFTFEKVMSFIQFLKGLDLTSIGERKMALADDSFIRLDQETKQRIVTLLSTEDGEYLLKELVESGLITSVDITNIGYRKKQLETFYRLLNEPSYLSTYQIKEHLTDTREEITWQHFFKSNPWIFGYGLDYRFLGILQKEAHLSNTNVAGRDGEIGDFLLGCNKFTALVELKKPTTPLFMEVKNRSGSWCLSGELIYAVSQILEQKASWQIKAETNATKNFNDNKDLIKQKTLDPKTYLIVGKTSQFTGESEEQQTKARTFELFQRDSRNLDIITFKELEKEKVNLILTARKIEETEANTVATLIDADLSKTEDIQRLIQKVNQLGQIDALINVAGIGVYKSIENLNIDDWENSLKVNLTAPMLLTKGLITNLQHSPLSLVLNIGSGAGTMGFKNRSAYCASKFGLRGFSLSLSEEYANSKPSFCLITLGSTMTTFASKTIEEQKEKVAKGEAVFPVEWVAKRLVEIIMDEKREPEIVLYPGNEGFGVWKKP